MKQHAKLSASKLERVMLCPGSLNLEADIPDTTNDAADRGNKIHFLGEKLIEHNMRYSGDHECDDEMVQIAINYAEFVRNLAEDYSIFVEMDLQPYLSTLHPDLGGHADAIIVKGKELHVIDLKTGNIKVPAKNNKQLLMYGLGAYRAFEHLNIEKIVLHIYQPFNPTTPFEVTPKELMDFKELLMDIVHQATDPFAPTIAGTKQCRYCKAKTVCPSIKEKAIMNAQTDFQTTNKPLSELLGMAELCTMWADAIKEEAKALVMNGGSIEGYTLKEGRKMQKWNEKAKIHFHNIPEAWDLKSVAAIKKLKLEVPSDLIIETRSAPSLVKIED